MKRLACLFSLAVLFIAISVATVLAQNGDSNNSDASNEWALEDDVIIGHPNLARLDSLALTSCLPTDGDLDGDGLSDQEEASLGTNKQDADTDSDQVDDATEVGNPSSPNDGDGDGLIDALESLNSDHDLDGKADQIDPSSGPQALRGQFTPMAISDDNSDSSRIEIQVVGGSNVSAVGVRLDMGYMEFLVAVDGHQIFTDELIALYDDGSHGDVQASDNKWTRGGFHSGHNLAPGSVATNPIRHIMIVDDGSAVEHNVWQSRIFDTSLGLVDATTVPNPVAITSNIQKALHLVNLVNPCGLVASRSASSTRVTRQFYTHFKDEYDFLTLHLTIDDPTTNPGWFLNVSNQIHNIGLPIFDSSNHHGSAERLTGLITLNYSPSDDTGYTINHEVLHNWAAFGLEPLGYGQCSHQPSAHWGLAGVGNAYLGGFDPAKLVDNGEGSYSILDYRGQGDVFVPIEMYFAGFADSGSVPSMPIPINADCGSFTYPGNWQVDFKADGLKSVTIQDVQNQLGGVRIPGWSESKRSFTLAGVVVSNYLLSPAEMAYFAVPIEAFGKTVGNGVSPSFEEATMGESTMDTRIGDVIVRDKLVFLPMIDR